MVPHCPLCDFRSTKHEHRRIEVWFLTALSFAPEAVIGCGPEAWRGRAGFATNDCQGDQHLTQKSAGYSGPRIQRRREILSTGIGVVAMVIMYRVEAALGGK